jgi:hypothetical protein
MTLYGLPKAVVDELPPEKQQIIRQMTTIVPIRIAVLNDVEWNRIFH